MVEAASKLSHCACPSSPGVCGGYLHLDDLCLGIFLLQDHDLVYFNGSLARMFGCERNEFEGVVKWPFDDPGLMGHVRGLIPGEPAREGSAAPLLSQGVGKGGRTVWVEVVATRVTHAGRPAVMGQAVDVTDRVRAEEALSRAESRRKLMEQQLIRSKAMLQAVFDGISDPLVLLGRDMTVRMLNRAARDYYGIDGYRDAVGKPCSVLRSPHESEAACEECRVKTSMAEGKVVVFERKSPFTPFREEEVFLYPLSWNAPVAEGVILRICDITEIKAATREVVHRQKLESLGILVSGIAHEIKNPNNFISFNLPILREYLDQIIPILDARAAEEPDLLWTGLPYGEFRADLFKLLDNIQHGSERIGGIASDLRAFSRKNDELCDQRILVRDVVERALSLARGSLSASILSTEICIAEELTEIWGCPEALEQVLVNLLINAAQAADKEYSRIEIRARLCDSDRRDFAIEVEDNGMGMEPDVAAHVFDPFFTTKARQEGTGLGLYVCRNLVHSMGGRIEVKSTPAVGTCFRIVLPLNGMNPPLTSIS